MPRVRREWDDIAPNLIIEECKVCAILHHHTLGSSLVRRHFNPTPRLPDSSLVAPPPCVCARTTDLTGVRPLALTQVTTMGGDLMVLHHRKRGTRGSRKSWKNAEKRLNIKHTYNMDWSTGGVADWSMPHFINHFALCIWQMHILLQLPDGVIVRITRKLKQQNKILTVKYEPTLYFVSYNNRICCVGCLRWAFKASKGLVVCLMF